VWNGFWVGAGAWPGDPPRVVARARTAAAWLEAIAGGRGLGLTSAGIARFYPRPGLRAVPVPGLPPSVLALARPGEGAHGLAAPFVAAALGAAREAPEVVAALEAARPPTATAL